jgi:hypothetical protein
LKGTNYDLSEIRPQLKQIGMDHDGDSETDASYYSGDSEYNEYSKKPFF